MSWWKVLAALAGVGVAGVTAILYVGFGAFLPWREQAEIGRLVELAGVRPGQTVAEIGAGRGRFSIGLAGRVGETGHVYATELAGPTFDVLSARVAGLTNVTPVRAGREDLGLAAACCDLVLMRNMYHHVRDPAAFLARLRPALRPGGRVVVIDFAPDALWFHGGRPTDASDRRPGHGVAPEAAIAEFTSPGYGLDISRRPWSGPLWLLMFRLD